MISTLKFCGRDVELNLLVERWKLASNIENPLPQLVVITAERGIGKTRLVLEFYRRLCEINNQSEKSCYWPDATTIIDRNLEVNPSLCACNFKEPMPYLWWGIRAGDPGTENGVAGDAIATYNKFLSPHLVPLLDRSTLKNRAIGLAKTWGNVGMDFASSALQVDNLVSIGKGIISTVKVLTDGGSDSALKDALSQPYSRANEVISQMEMVFSSNKLTYAKIPGLIFLDDAQFAHKDPALTSFIETLLYKVITQSWPVMILATHWKREYSADLMPPENSFAGIVNHSRKRTGSNEGPGACLPGGYLSDDIYSEITLDLVPDLSQALAEKLPGLTKQQSEAILERTDGNPRYLDQIIAYLLEHEDYFENINPACPLTTQGFEKTLNQSQSIHNIVLQRLREVPDDVQEAICLASLQGVRFSNDFVDALGLVQIGRSVHDSLRQGEYPYCLLTGTNTDNKQSIGQFSEHLFYEVASDRRKSLKSLGGELELQSNFRNGVITIVGEQDNPKSTSPDSLALVFGIAANLFEFSTDPDERTVAQKALGKLAWFELSRNSIEAAAAAYERLLAIQSSSLDLQKWRLCIETWEVLVRLYRSLHWPVKRLRALKQVFASAVPDEPFQFLVRLSQNDPNSYREHFGLATIKWTP